MHAPSADEIWKHITALLDEQLQYGYLEQAKAVTEVQLVGGELVLSVKTPEARDFFSAHINQQRLIILSRSKFQLESVRAELVETTE